MTNTMIMRTMTTMRRMTEDREVVAIATENQGRTMDTEVEEVTEETVEVVTAAVEETTTEAITAGEVIEITTTETNKRTTELMKLVRLKTRREFSMLTT